MLLRLYNDDSPLIDSSKDRFHAKQDGDAPDAAVAADLNMVVDEDENGDSAAPDKRENSEGDAGMQDDKHVIGDDETGENAESITER